MTPPASRPAADDAEAARKAVAMVRAGEAATPVEFSKIDAATISDEDLEQAYREADELHITDGLRDPACGRVLEGEWRAAMVRLRDSIELQVGRINGEQGELGQQPGHGEAVRDLPGLSVQLDPHALDVARPRRAVKPGSR